MSSIFVLLPIWPSFHVALSNGSVFVDFSVKSKNNTISNMSLSLVNMETNTSVLSRPLPGHQLVGREEFDCSCFLYAGTFRFLLRQTSITTIPNANGSDVSHTVTSASWWSSELQVQWPTFHISVERAGNHSEYFQVGLSTNEHFQACSSGMDSALLLEVSYSEYNQIGRNTTNKVRGQIRKPIKPLRSQRVELPCAFWFTERDFITVVIRSPHTEQEVKNSGPLYPSRIFPYKLLVENVNAYKSGCMDTMTVKMITPPCTHVNGKIQLYNAKESSLLAFNWLTQEENETEFNCSVFYPGRNKYCFRFVFNFSRLSSPAEKCLVVYRSAESWGPWQPWSVCSVSCGEGVRERARECLLPSGVEGVKCAGMVKERSPCSLEDCNSKFLLSSPSPSLPSVPVGASPFGGNMIVVLGISICLAVIMVTIVVTVWRKLYQTPQCSSVHRGSIHPPGGRKLSDEASICGHSLQRPSLSDGHFPSAAVISQKRPSLGAPPLSPQAPVMTLSQDPERLSPTGQKVLPPIFGYRLAQQQLKEMKKQGLKEATQLYHVSSSPVHDTVVETCASPTTSPVPSPTGFVSDWVEMVERSKMAGLRGGDTVSGNSYNRNPNFRRTSSFNDTKLLSTSSAQSMHFRERSMTQVTHPSFFYFYFSGTGERKTRVDSGGRGGDLVSGIGGPSLTLSWSREVNQLDVERAERAEQNWNRRGPSPIQRNILARKLKEAQLCSGGKGRQRSSSFNMSSSECRRDWCQSLPISRDQSSSGGSPYRLSEAEQRMLDLDLSPVKISLKYIHYTLSTRFIIKIVITPS
uniref:Thrombospondin type 1 domain containing 1 n=1 Tax=Cyprinodon variegatus TaxID=28743 RepID=A0A3Q2DGA4_CYPVA